MLLKARRPQQAKLHLLRAVCCHRETALQVIVCLRGAVFCLAYHATDSMVAVGYISLVTPRQTTMLSMDIVAQ